MERRERAGVIATKSSATDLVSEADRASERLIVERIQQARPNDALVAEEGSAAPGGSGVRWFIDPLDGTINYLYRVPHWAVTLCCADERGPLAGVVFDPLRDELFTASRGGGAYVGGTRLRVSAKTELASALVATGFGYGAVQRVTQGRILANVIGAVRDVRRFGSAALDLSYVAAGRFDAYFESVDAPWDWMAGAMLVREAGGRVTELTPSDPALPRIIASGPGLHDALTRMLADAVHKAQNSID